MPKKLKKPTTFIDQVHIMEGRGIVVDDTAACADFLAHVNYYRLSGYIYPFLDHKTDMCLIPIEFSQIENIYNFDTELRNLIAGTIETIEIYCRVQFAYFNAHAYGANGYMNANSYHPNHNHSKFLIHVNRCIAENQNSPVVKHHMNVYGGQFPIWVIIDYFSLGMLSYFYSDMRNHDKATLAQNMYSTNYQALSSWLRCLTDLRNRCAHYSRLYDWNFSAVPRIPQGNNFKADRSLFSQLYMLKMMYPYPNKWNEDFVKPLTKLIKKYGKSIDKSLIGFPRTWKSLLM